eukprot:2282378-Rhodomonas_salina.1
MRGRNGLGLKDVTDSVAVQFNPSTRTKHSWPLLEYSMDDMYNHPGSVALAPLPAVTHPLAQSRPLQKKLTPSPSTRGVCVALQARH